MLVSFMRKGRRSYAVQVTRVGFPAVEMNPAPGYDDLLPHDIVHFVVEREFGLARGVYGQLAAGGDAGTFRVIPTTGGARERSRTQRRHKKRGDRLAHEGRHDTEVSEMAASICYQAWLALSPLEACRARARALAPYVARLRSTNLELGALSDAKIRHVCARLDEISARWVALDVGQSLELEWSSASPSGSRDVSRHLHGGWGSFALVLV